jgi:Uma2 family endonuclease
MATQPKTSLTPEQYLEIERKAEFKSEYYQGEMYAMSGARMDHNRLVVNMVAQIHAQLRGRPCEVCSNDLRVRVGADELYTYPDIVVTCDPRFLDAEYDTLLNPVVIIEVLSPSTEAYDRGKKFGLYRTLDTLREYVVVSSDRVQVERFTRQDSGQWLLTAVNRLEDSIELESIGCKLSLKEAYEHVEFSAET